MDGNRALTKSVKEAALRALRVNFGFPIESCQADTSASQRVSRVGKVGLPPLLPPSGGFVRDAARATIYFALLQNDELSTTEDLTTK